MVTFVTVPTQRARQPSSEIKVLEQSSASEARSRPVWKTILKVAFTVVLIAAIVIAGKILIPKVVQFVATAATAAGSVVEVATETAAVVDKVAKGAKHVLFKPLAYDIMNAVDAVATSVNSVTDGLFVNTVQKIVEASQVVSPKLAVMTYLPWLVLTAPRSFPIKGE